MATSPITSPFKEKHTPAPLSRPCWAVLPETGLCCGEAPGDQAPTRPATRFPPGSRSRQSPPLFGPPFPQLPNEGSKKDSNCLSQRQKCTRINATVHKLLNPVLTLSPAPEKTPQSGVLHCDPPHRRRVLKSELPETPSWGLSWALFSSYVGFLKSTPPNPSHPASSHSAARSSTFLFCVQSLG